MKKEATKPRSNWKRYLISSLDTFVTGFLVALGTNLDALSMTSDWQNMKVLLFSAVCGAGLAGVRAVIKGLREGLLSK